MNLTPVIELTIGVVIGLALGVTITYLLMRRESEHYRSQLHAQSEASGASREAPLASL